MNKAIGVVLVALGALLVFQVVAKGWLLFLLIAIGLGFLANSGTIGRWGYGGAALFGLLAMAMVSFRGMILSMGMMIKLMPVLLVGYGVYVLLRSFGK